ncbi:MAG TPA: hypothetical protein DCL54_19595 [Alphaproteobacteria bacterium]|nr:hypothetical protein [Alphaproteobacteria bacterium]
MVHRQDACLKFLREAADATVLLRGVRADRLKARLSVIRPDGTQDQFDVLIEPRGASSVSVREAVVGCRLPSWCPDRHINADGSFCLSWAEAEPLTIDSLENAQRWWAALFGFLKRQRIAERARRWPMGRSRAHGPDAAQAEAEAEAIAGSLGYRLLSDLRRGKLSAKFGIGTGVVKTPGWSFYLDGRRILNIRYDGIITGLSNRTCLCDLWKIATPSACRDHQGQVIALGMALVRQQEAEALFWSEAKRRLVCCRSMDSCPLNPAVQEKTCGGLA